VTSADEYLDEVRRGMLGMAGPIRDDVVRELRGHIAESAAANGGNMDASLASLGSPREVGRHYRDLYGYGAVFKVLFAAIAFVLAVPSIPVLLVGPDTAFPFSLSLLFVIAAAAWILWVSVAAGSRAGIGAGLAAMSGRLAAFATVAATQEGAITTVGGLGILFAVSFLFVLLGWMPGTARRVWSGPRAEL
jgi:hypothetical protein